MELNTFYINITSNSSSKQTGAASSRVSKWDGTIARLTNLRDQHLQPTASPVLNRYTHFLKDPFTWIRIPVKLALQTTICVISSLWTFAIGAAARDSKIQKPGLHAWALLGGLASVGMVAMGLASWAIYRNIHFAETCAEQEKSGVFLDIKNCFNGLMTTQLQDDANKAIEKAHEACLSKIKAAAGTKVTSIYRDKINRAISEMRNDAITSVIERLQSDGVQHV